MLLKILLVLFSLLAPHDLLAAGQSWQPGLRTIGDWSSDPDIRLDLNIWYPCLRQPSKHNFPPWQISASLNAKAVPGKFPLLVLSHPSPASRFSYSGLAAWLARQGFVVVAPTHGRDNLDNMEDLFSWKQLERRVAEINRAIFLLETDKNLSPMIDFKRIGLIGFGPGASAGLLLGGCLPNCEAWKDYCLKTIPEDIYCAGKTREKINAICKNFPLKKSLANPSIKAIAMVGPEYAMLFDEKSFKYFYPPALLVEIGRERMQNSAGQAKALGRILGSRALYLDLPDADAGALMDACPNALRNELPELCESVSANQRKLLRQNLENALFSFFSHYLLQAKNLPDIPNPPELTQKPETPPAESPKNAKTQRKRPKKS